MSEAGESGEHDSEETFGDHLLCGLFVGGRPARMGSPKGLLLAPSGVPLLVATWKTLEEALPRSPRWVVGRRPEYESFRYPTLVDAVPDAGPLAGLVALLAQAAERSQKGVVAVACDLPYLTPELLRRLVRAAPDEDIVAPFLDDRFQPLCARYSVSVLPRFRQALEVRQLALQPLLHELGAEAWAVSPSDAAQLRDWDRPEDVQSS